MRLWICTFCVGIVLLVNALALAESFNMEEHFDSPVPLPQAVASKIISDIGSKFSKYGCIEKTVDALLEGKEIRLGPKGERGFLVRPKSLCACAVYSCPFWLFIIDKAGTYRMAAKIDAHTLTIDQKQITNGLFQLNAYSGTAGWDNKSKWTYDGTKYLQTKHIYRDKMSIKK